MTKGTHFPDSEKYSGLHFFNETESSLPVRADDAKQIISLIEDDDECHFQFVEIVFVDEAKIKAVNREYLRREYVTDVISFAYNENEGNLQTEGTLYCCAPRIYEQAEELDQPAEREFRRIIIHGLLHLIGYDDQSEQERKKMRRREDFYLEKYRLKE